MDSVGQRLRSPLGLAAIIIVLILAAGSAYFIWNSGLLGSNSSVSVQPSPVEVMSYYLEIDLPGGNSGRATGLDPLAVGQTFKFHFISPRDGYLYIIAPEKNEALKTFLTGEPIPDSGVQTNRVEAGANYSFPAGEDNWIEIGPEGKVTTFTVIFSPQALTTPGFLAERAGRALTAVEQEEFAELQRLFAAKPSESAAETRTTQHNIVIVKFTERPAENAPRLFDVPIQSR